MKKALIILGVIFTFIFIFVLGFLISFFLFRSTSVNTTSDEENTEVTDEVNDNEDEVVVEEPKFNEKYSIVNHQLCNLSFPLISNEIFQAEMEANGEIGNFDKDKHWIFNDSEGYLQGDIKFTNLLDIKYTFKPYISALGSGYTSGTISIQCAKNSDGLTTEELYSKLTVGEASDQLKEIYGSDALYVRHDDENKWDHDVIVYGDNMSLDTGIKKYVLATDTHIYLILFRSNTDNERLLKEVNYIFDNLSFN